MKFCRTLGLAGLLSLAAAPALADTYCEVTRHPVCMGCSANETMKTVVSTYPRPKPPARDSNVWCGLSYRSMSAFYKTMAIPLKPKLGIVGVNKYDFGYKSAKTGHDSFTIQTFQLNGLNGKPANATVHFDVEIVDKPF